MVRLNQPNWGSECGCYYNAWSQGHSTKKLLPLSDVSAHTAILSTACETVLRQKYVNPSTTLDIPECQYVFPLYDNVSVVAFAFDIGPRRVTGIVKEKSKAKEGYDAAVALGETAGLFKQGPTSDVFTTKLGNIPAGETIVVNISYVQVLPQVMGANSIRFTLPTKISPRCGNTDVAATGTSISTARFAVTVDVQMDETSPLQQIKSTSHPISVVLGRVSTDPPSHHSPSRASATLALYECALDRDFILEILHQNSRQPRALLERHPEIPGQRALMATMIPKTISQLAKPEVVFVADQSGSMRGRPTQTLVSALSIFFKSLPVGIKFNVCLFGTGHTFLFDKSQTYEQVSLTNALDMLKGLNGDHGGTETLSAVKASIESRDLNSELSVILAMDGDIWQQQALFDYLNTSVSASKKALRVFALGIGDSVSSALIEGVARAGNGFAQTVGNGESLDTKVIRMLKGALTPDYGALNLEVVYHTETTDDEDFVLVERVTDSLRVMVLDEHNTPENQQKTELRSASAAQHELTADENNPNAVMADGESAQGHVRPTKAVSVPRLLQIPQHIPPLYPFTRTTVYLLLSPEASQGTSTSVILRGSSQEHPFEMEIPVEILPQPSKTIHQLAAKRAVLELEEGRGWLEEAKESDGTLLKHGHSNDFKALIEREAVRLGVQYQIAGKHTSFVAVDSHDRDTIGESTALEITITKALPLRAGVSGPPYARLSSTPVRHNRTSLPPRKSTGGKAPRMQLASKAARKATPSSVQIFSSKRPCKKSKKQIFTDPTSEAAPPLPAQYHVAIDENPRPPSVESTPQQSLLALQSFEGYWDLSDELVDITDIPPIARKVPDRVQDERVWATMLAILWFERECKGEWEAWEMIVQKARGWLGTVGVSVDDETGKAWWESAEKVIHGKGR